MRLLSVSAGRLHVIQIGSEVVKTGHLKAVQAEPWIITDTGVAGDQRAVHPDALYAFSRQAYRYWGAQLAVDPARWPDGFFGENLTFETLDEEDLRVGDVFALGDEVRLFVAGARNPCLKLSWRLGQPPAFQRQFAKSRHAGLYMGVAAPGRVRPGDRLERIEHDPAMPSVADVSDFLMDRDPPPLDALDRLFAHPRTSRVNRMLLGPKREAAARARDRQEGRWSGWRPFRIDTIVEETADIRSVRLRPIDGGRLPRAMPGQHLSVRLADPDGEISRSWSLSAFDLEPDSYRITVRRQEGRGSRGLHRLTLGEQVMIRAPAGEFTLDMGSFRPLVLVGAGIGITPLKAMLDAHLLRSGEAPVHIIYGGRAPEAMAFRAELEALAAAHDHVKLTLVYSRVDAGPSLRGRITPQIVIDALAGLSVTLDGHRGELPWFEAAIYICGPGDFCTELTAGLIARGGNASIILSERFGVTVETTEIEEATVHFAASGAVARWTKGDDLTLLELAEAAGLAPDNDCRSGTCLTCRTRLLAGSCTGDLGDGTILPCIARPLSEDIRLDI